MGCRKSTAEVLGKLLSLIGLLREAEESSSNGSATTDGIMVSSGENQLDGILYVFRQVLGKEKDCFIELRQQDKVADTEVLVRLLEVSDILRVPMR